MTFDLLKYSYQDEKECSLENNIDKINSWVNNEKINYVKYKKDGEDILEKPLDENLNLETMNESYIDKNSIYMLLNPYDDSNYEKANSEDIYYGFASNDISFRSKFDFVTEMEIRIKKTENLNEFLSHNIVFTIGGTTIIDSTIRLQVALSQIMNKNRKIIITDEYIKLPLFICYIFEKNRIKPTNFTFHQMKINIYNNNNKFINTTYEFVLKGGYFPLDLRKPDDISFMTLMTNTFSLIIDDYITLIYIDIFNRTCGLFIWYIVDDSDFGELQSLQPIILQIIIEINYLDKTFTKIIHPNDIKKINHKKYIGYYIETNILSFDDFINYFQSKIKKMDIMKKLIKLKADELQSSISIHWNNFHPGSKIYYELCCLNIVSYHEGCFIPKFIN